VGNAEGGSGHGRSQDTASRDRQKQMCADLYRVLDKQGKNSFDFVDIVRIMHPELSKRDVAILASLALPAPDVTILDEEERRRIQQDYEERMVTAKGPKLQLYQVVALARERLSTAKLSKLTSILARQGVDDSDEVDAAEFLA